MSNKLFVPAIIILFLTSCEKVINVKLDNATPQYVIQAELFEGTNPFRVQVNKTTSYFGTDPQLQVDDAIITLYDAANNAVAVPSIGNGLYELPSFTAMAGNTYRLKVQAGGGEFTASSTVPHPVVIDSVSIEFQESDFLDEGYEVAAIFSDPAGQQNFYRVILTVNDTLQNEPNDLYLVNDKYNNGKTVRADVFERFEMGDKIQFELRGMDEQVFSFYTSLREILNNGNSPAPANPNTNIKGGALGYFGAFTSSKKTVVIQ